MPAAKSRSGLRVRNAREPTSQGERKGKRIFLGGGSSAERDLPFHEAPVLERKRGVLEIAREEGGHQLRAENQ